MTLGLLALPVILFLFYLVETRQVQSFVIASYSMEPALRQGEGWLMGPHPEQLRRGEMIVFHPPGDDVTQVVKRVIAVAGDRVATRKGQLYLNGKPAPPPQGDTPPTPDMPDREWLISPGQVFVSGDNRPTSHDSRDYGPIPLSRIEGVLLRRIAAAPGGD